MSGERDFWHGRAELVEQFGTVVVEDGEIVEPGAWESNWMLKLPGGLPGWLHPVYLNRLIAEATVRLFARWDDVGGYRVEHVGFFAPRSKRGYPALLSLHTYGIAFDLNPDANPLQAPGEPVRTNIPRPWIDVAKGQGWTWGGDFRRPDPMHFQRAAGV